VCFNQKYKFVNVDKFHNYSKVTKAAKMPLKNNFQEECGKPVIKPLYNQNVGKGKVINGYTPIPHSLPWTVSLRVDGGPNHICGGSLVRCPGKARSNLVISAAHCMDPYVRYNYIVLNGRVIG